MIELGTLLAGPFTGRLLGDLGAEIIKVEAPGQPDPIRDWGKARYEGRSLWWPVQSRNKKCVTLNLRSERGQELLLRLVEHADVVTENFRPGTLERWNLGYEQLWRGQPGIVLARVSGYGQTGPYAERAGFASVSEAMGGIRHINGFPGEAPPRMHISLGDSLAGMFAAQGILVGALLARRLRRRARSGRRRLADGGRLRAAREHRARVRQARHRSRASGHESQGDRAVQHLPVARRQVDGDRGERRRRVPPPVRARSGGPSSPTTSGSPPISRAATTRTRSRGSSPTWARERDAAEIDRVLNEAGVICGPIYTIADIFEDPQFQAREMLLEHVDPEFGPYVGPGHRAEADANAGRRPLVGDLGGRQPQRRGLRRPARALRRRARRAAARRACCDTRVTHLRRRSARRAPERRRRSSSRPCAPSWSTGSPRPGCRAIEAVSFVSPARVPQMAGAEEVVAAIERRDGSRLRGARSERARVRPAARRPGSTRCTSRSRPRESSTSGTRAPPSPSRSPPPSASSDARGRTASARP